MRVAATTVTLAAIVAPGCGTLDNGRPWAADATLLPGWEAVTDAAADTMTDPWTWVPLGLAAVLSIDDWDEEVAEWAIEETPIFGSQENAADWSDDLRDALDAASLATTFATPGGDDFGAWWWPKTKGVGARYFARGLTRELTDNLKKETERTRPDLSNTKSFPSGHTSSAFAHATWTRLNLNDIPMDENVRLASKVTVMGMASAVAWARVESAKHFPTDVLVGAAIGNIFSRFVHDAFLGLPEAGGPEIDVEVVPGESVAIGLVWR